MLENQNVARRIVEEKGMLAARLVSQLNEHVKLRVRKMARDL